MKCKKIMALALAAALALGMLAGCCEDSSSSGSTEEVTLNTIDDAALTDTIGDVLWENGILDDTNANVSCSYEKSSRDQEPVLYKLFESWDVEKIIAIGNGPLTQEILANLTVYESLQDGANRESLFKGERGLYLDGIVIPSDAEVNDAVNAVADYLENYGDPSGENSLKDLPDSCDGGPCYYNFAFKIVQVGHSGNGAYVVLIIIDVSSTPFIRPVTA